MEGAEENTESNKRVDSEKGRVNRRKGHLGPWEGNILNYTFSCVSS